MKNGQKIYDAVNLGTSVVNAPVANLCALICISMWLSPLALTGLIILYVFYLSQVMHSVPKTFQVWWTRMISILRNIWKTVKCLITFILQYWLIHLINYCKDIASEYTHIRIQKTIEVLNSIRLIKINGWEQHFIQNINSEWNQCQGVVLKDKLKILIIVFRCSQ